MLRFGSGDAPKDRARAAAFTLAAMVREREADVPLEPEPRARPWIASASLFASLALPNLHGGGGVRLELRHEVFRWLQLGAAVETGLSPLPAASVLQPALLAEVAVPLTRGSVSTAVVLGGGVAAPILSRGGSSFTTWLGLLQLAVEGRVALGSGHGLRFALSGQLVPTSLSIQVGSDVLGSVGPLWLRTEVGYFGDL